MPGSLSKSSGVAVLMLILAVGLTTWNRLAAGLSFASAIVRTCGRLTHPKLKTSEAKTNNANAAGECILLEVILCNRLVTRREAIFTNFCTDSVEVGRALLCLLLVPFADQFKRPLQNWARSRTIGLAN